MTQRLLELSGCREPALQLPQLPHHGEKHAMAVPCRILKLFAMSLVAVVLVAPSVPGKTNAQIALMSRVNAALRADRRLNGAYCYSVAPGVVVLHGKVFDEAARTLAESTARKVRGVRQVINSLLTETGEWHAEEARINDTLALNGFTDLTVRVIGSQAYLSGTVVGEADQQRALRVIGSISRLQIVNFSRVLPGSVF